MAKMNHEIKAHWVAALRSGEYKQTHRKLTDNEGSYCCLGVLCDLYARTKGVGALYDLESDEHSELPNDAVLSWAGMSINDRLSIGGLAMQLYEHNDGGCGRDPRTFAEIADAIESQL
jgi:hypothetical protein